MQSKSTEKQGQDLPVVNCASSNADSQKFCVLYAASLCPTDHADSLGGSVPLAFFDFCRSKSPELAVFLSVVKKCVEG